MTDELPSFARRDFMKRVGGAAMGLAVSRVALRPTPASRPRNHKTFCRVMPHWSG